MCFAKPDYNEKGVDRREHLIANVCPGPAWEIDGTSISLKRPSTWFGRWLLSFNANHYREKQHPRSRRLTRSAV